MMASKVLQTLVDRDLVVRQPDPADGRVKRLGLTPDGGELTGVPSASRPTSTRRCSAPGGDPLRETLQNIAARARAAS
jgi:hypothetical protein